MILVAIGSNLPTFDNTPEVACKEAVVALSCLPGLRVQRTSRWYESAPVPPSGQPPYVNGVARLDGEVDPAALLAMLHDVEQAFGRTRSIPNAARTLDLDIVAMSGLVRTAPDPVLPHPRMHERAFVLRPLIDVAPGWVHPIFGVTGDVLLARLPPQDIHPLGAAGIDP